MDCNNIIVIKSKQFSLRIIKLYQFMMMEHKEYVLSKQLLRAGTSIGANVAEAEQAQSKADFISKISIALKEATETDYWIRLLNATDYLSNYEIKTILANCNELERILTAIIKSSKNSL